MKQVVYALEQAVFSLQKPGSYFPKNKQLFFHQKQAEEYEDGREGPGKGQYLWKLKSAFEERRGERI